MDTTPKQIAIYDLALQVPKLKLDRALMRHVDDAGIVAIMDGRLTQKSYGRTLRKSLPPFKPLQSFTACEDFWRETVIPALSLPDASDLI